MGNANFMNKLKKFGKTLKTAKERAATEGFGADLPDGVYKARLESFELTESKSSGRLQVAMQFKILAGDEKGQSVFKYQSVETEDDQVWLDRDLKRFGVEAPENSDDLVAIIKAIDEAKPEVKIALKTKDAGQFTYINKVLTEVDFGDLASEGAEEDEDDDSHDDDDQSDEDAEAEEEAEEEADDDAEEEEADEDADADEDESEEEEAEDGEEVEITVGMTVCFEGKSGKAYTGKVVKLLEDEGKVKVKVDDKTYTVESGDISLPEEKEAEEEEKPPVKAKAKPAVKAPAKKVVKKKVTKK